MRTPRPVEAELSSHKIRVKPEDKSQHVTLFPLEQTLPTLNTRSVGGDVDDGDCSVQQPKSS